MNWANMTQWGQGFFVGGALGIVLGVFIAIAALAIVGAARGDA